MGRYFVEFAYDGTDYHGWQIQPNGNSVQEELQKALSMILRMEISVVGAGRTDTGVHARRMTAHFEIDRNIDCEQLAYKLNRLLPRDIAVYSVYPICMHVSVPHYEHTIIIYTPRRTLSLGSILARCITTSTST